MNQHPGAGPRPPSYTGYPPGVAQGRAGSPNMVPGGNPRTPPSQVLGGPPPINTAPGGYQQHQQQMGAPSQQIPGPPGYGGQQPYAPQGGMVPAPYVSRNGAVEVEGAGRSKSQLIVGIDFVSLIRNRDEDLRRVCRS